MGVCTADSRLCRSRVAAKIFVFIISRKFCKIINFVFLKIFSKFHEISWNSNKCHQNFVFREIFLEFRDFQIILSTFRVSQNLHNAVSQQPYVGVEEEEGGSGGGRLVLPCAPSPLTQIVPISASIYNVFHSVFYNSVGPSLYTPTCVAGATWFTF